MLFHHFFPTLADEYTWARGCGCTHAIEGIVACGVSFGSMLSQRLQSACLVGIHQYRNGSAGRYDNLVVAVMAIGDVDLELFVV